MKQHSVLWILKKLRRHLPALFVLTLCTVSTSLLGVAFAVGTKNIINGAISGSRGQLIHAAVVQMIIILGILISSILARFLRSRLTAVLSRDWHRTLTHQVLQAEYSKISEMHTGELLNRIRADSQTVTDTLLSAVPSIASMAMKLVAVFAVLFSMAPVLTGCFLLVGILLTAVTGLARRYLRELNKDVSASNGRVAGFLQEVFEKLLLVQAMNLNQEVENRAENLLAQQWNLQKKRRWITVTANSCISIFGYFTGFAVLLWCAWGLFQGTMNFGELTAITQLAAQLQGPLVNLSGIFPSCIAMTAAAERLMELEQLCRPVPCTDKPPVYDEIREIAAEGLSFSYGRDQVLEKSSFSLPRGSFTVITGPSGIGKSTLLKLFLGIFPPLEGSLCFRCTAGSVPVSKASSPLFAYVPQGNLLFSGTLRENLLISCPDASEAQLQEAVRISCMDAFLPQLPDGLETVLGENAHGLSEGQAQRLSIARAILGGAPILLLDEATSALDAQTEETVLRRIRSLPDKTCIAVTHRPAALQLADWQLEIDTSGVHCHAPEHTAGSLPEF